METKRKKIVKMKRIPMMPLRGLMIFPHMALHFDVGRPRSVAALEAAMIDEQRIFLVAQKDAETENPGQDDIYQVGTIAQIKQVLNLPGNSLRVLVEGIQRASLKRIVQEDPFWVASVQPIASSDAAQENVLQALMRTAQELFEEFARISSRVSEETLRSVNDVTEPDQLSDVIAANVLMRLEDRQAILEEAGVAPRLERLCEILAREIELAGIEKQVQARLKKQIEKNQKDYYLREQIRAIQEELGENDAAESDALRERIEKLPLNEEAHDKALRELDRMARMAPGTPEVSVIQSYLEWICDLPWGKYTKDDLDLKRAREILDADHYGMKQVKERVIEYLAVRRMQQQAEQGTVRAPILCFVGPPGVGKTSIVKGIAKAMGRKFIQMSLGGVRDEAEIRGHRRTYIGAIPGRIIAGMKQAGTMNPVFLFDEIDKMGNDFRGDPASAMLEVLDGEQNMAFRDHYLELPFDLSQVTFITTANTKDTIPAPLLDRMEIIEVPSYTEEEKLQIAKRHLLPRVTTEHGLPKGSLRVTDAAIRMMIEGYTREAGVRTLQRTLEHAARKAAVELLENQEKSVTIGKSKVIEYLGSPRYQREMPEKAPCIGVVNGLTYTVVGGETLAVECATMPGSGALRLTGQLGDVMKESAQAALSWIRAHSNEYGLDPDFYKELDIHIHVPEGAVPKDGPSAGVTMVTALLSAVSGRPVRQGVAMTGEITLRGRVLPIGGVKEKLLAAYRAGLHTILLPKENAKDLEDIPPYVLDTFHIILTEKIDDVLRVALLPRKSEE